MLTEEKIRSYNTYKMPAKVAKYKNFMVTVHNDSEPEGYYEQTCKVNNTLQ